MKGYYNYHVDTACFYGADRYTAEIEVKEVLNFEIAVAKVSFMDERQLKAYLNMEM